MWLEYIRSYIEDLCHGFLASGWLVQIVGLSNPLEVVVHYLLIRRMTSDFSYWDEFPMVSALVFMVTYWAIPIVSHDIRLSSCHDFTKLLHYVVSQPWENAKLVPKFIVTLTYILNLKMVIYSLWIDSLLMEVSSNRYS